MATTQGVMVAFMRVSSSAISIGHSPYTSVMVAICIV